MPARRDRDLRVFRLLACLTAVAGGTNRRAEGGPMRTSHIAARNVAVAAILTMAWLGSAAAEEKLVGTYGEERAVLAFKVPETTVQKLLPEGWESVPVASGPSQGSNLNVVFV